MTVTDVTGRVETMTTHTTDRVAPVVMFAPVARAAADGRPLAAAIRAAVVPGSDRRGQR